MAPKSQKTPPSRRTLGDLPPELKAIVARMARDQDRAYKARDVRLKFVDSCDWDGKSALALALVDRTWNLAVAPVLFERVDSRECSDSLFGFRIVPKYGRFVKVATFCHEESDDDDWQSLLRALPSFTNLEQLAFGDVAAVALFQAYGVRAPDEDQKTFREALRCVAPCVRHLVFQETIPLALDWILPMFVNLKRFEMTEDFVQPGYFEHAIKPLAQCGTLEHLSLVGETEGFLAENDNQQEKEPRSWPSLQSLTLGVASELRTHAWRFVLQFQDTLTRVALSVGAASLSDNLVANVPPSIFPHLEHLTIEAKDPDTTIKTLLELFAGSPIRHIVLSVLNSESGNAPYTNSLVKVALRRFQPHLQTIHIKYQPHEQIDQLDRLTVMQKYTTSTHNVALTISPSYDVFHHPHRQPSVPPSDPETNEMEQVRHQYFLGECRRDAEQVLNFTLERARGLQRTGDEVGMKRLLQTMHPLKSSMMLMKD